jgi:hypothetical protein
VNEGYRVNLIINNRAGDPPDRREKSGPVAFGKASRIYHMENPDCVWYHNAPNSRELPKEAMRDQYLPFLKIMKPYRNLTVT